jgi:hypothetical protein
MAVAKRCLNEGKKWLDIINARRTGWNKREKEVIKWLRQRAADISRIGS